MAVEVGRANSLGSSTASLALRRSMRGFSPRQNVRPQEIRSRSSSGRSATAIAVCDHPPSARRRSQCASLIVRPSDVTQRFPFVGTHRSAANSFNRFIYVFLPRLALYKPRSTINSMHVASIRCMWPEGRRVGTSVRPAAPKLKYPRARDQRTWIFRRTFEVKQRGRHFVAAGDRLRNDQVGRRIESRPWEGFRFTFYCDGLDDLDFRPADAGFQEVGIELAPD